MRIITALFIGLTLAPVVLSQTDPTREVQAHYAECNALEIWLTEIKFRVRLIETKVFRSALRVREVQSGMGRTMQSWQWCRSRPQYLERSVSPSKLSSSEVSAWLFHSETSSGC
jgi:hypothetical protein